MTPTCTRCGEPITDAAARLCNGCTRRLEDHLTDVPDTLAELDIATSRQTHLPASGQGARDCDHADDCGCGVRLPWDDRASRIASGLRTAIARWRDRLYLDDTNPSAGSPDPALWLADNVPAIRMRDWAPAMADDLDRRIKDADTAIYAPEEHVYAGPCGAPTDAGPCRRDLWAKTDKTHIRCPACGTTHVVKERQAKHLASLSGLTLPASEIAQAVTFITRTEFRAGTIRKWAHRGVLLRSNPAHEIRALYRVADVLQLRAQDEPTQDEQRAG